MGPQPPKKSSNVVLLSLGCGGLMFLTGVIALAGAGYLVRQRSKDLEGPMAAASLALRAAAEQAGAELSGNCKKAYDCCVGITSNAADTVSAAQCETFKLPGRTEAECTAALDGYVKAAKSRGVSCD
jgi:hypothetical protein